MLDLCNTELPPERMTGTESSGAVGMCEGVCVCVCVCVCGCVCVCVCVCVEGGGYVRACVPGTCTIVFNK